MAESQSRYAIVENLNERKSQAQKRLADMKKNKAIQEMQYKKDIQTLDRQIAESKSNYEQDHQAWVTNKRLEIEMKRQEFDDEIKQMESEIEGKEKTYVKSHQNFVKDQERLKDSQTEKWENVKEIKEMEIKSVEEEIEQIDKAINDLKEISNLDQSVVTRTGLRRG